MGIIKQKIADVPTRDQEMVEKWADVVGLMWEKNFLQQAASESSAQIKAAWSSLDQLPLSTDGRSQGLPIGRFGSELQDFAVMGRDGFDLPQGHQLHELLPILTQQLLFLRIRTPDEGRRDPTLGKRDVAAAFHRNPQHP